MPHNNTYTVGWICATKLEYLAALSFLDEELDVEQVGSDDSNIYTLGKIGPHYVVIGALREGQYGTSSAVGVARRMLRSFPSVRIGLMVGLGGGAPNHKNDIRLGDVVVSTSRNGHGGVFQYDFGEAIQNQALRITSFLDQPPELLREALVRRQAGYKTHGHELEKAINDAIIKRPQLLATYKRPNESSDVLFQCDIAHQETDVANCQYDGSTGSSSMARRVTRTSRDKVPFIHYGTIASAHQLMQDGLVRDALAEEGNVLCFEMEACGFINQFPCIVIRGICDYADSHKSKEWQGYAAMAAAAYAKDLLHCVQPSQVQAEMQISTILGNVHSLDARVDAFTRAIQAASAEGQQDLVKLLPDSVARTDTKNYFYDCSLLFASERGYKDIVQLLLENGADINATRVSLEAGTSVRDVYDGNALIAASKGGHRDIVRLLLENGADINAPGGSYGTALQASSSEGYRQIVQLLLDKGADININSGPYGTALSVASEKGHKDIVQLLLDKGADVNLQGGSYGNALQAASSEGHQEILEILLDHGANINMQGGFYNNALQAALEKGHLSIIPLLLDKGANINADGGRFGNALSSASEKGYKEVVELLLSNGADLNMPGGYYDSALQAAAANGHEEVIQLLLDYDTDIDKQREHYTNAYIKRYSSALQAASATNNLRVVRLLLDKGADTSAQDGSYTNALIVASANGNQDIVTLLLEKGANINAYSEHYGSALQASSATKKLEDVLLLLDKGANIDTQHCSALTVASQNGHEGIIRVLLDKGANVNAQCKCHGSALLASLARGHHKVSQFLLNRGANIGSYMSDQAFQDLLRDGCMSKSQFFRLFSPRSTDISASNHFVSLESIHNTLQSDSENANYCDIALDLGWDLLEFYRQELSAGDKLHHVLTLTGTPTVAEATSCEDFVRNRWGQDGIEILDLLVDCLCQNNRNYTTLSSKVYLEIDLPNLETGRLAFKETMVTLCGMSDRVASVIQLLAWLTAVFRVATAGCLTASTALFRQSPLMRVEGKDNFQMSPLLLEFPELLPGAPDSTRRSICWHRLFHGTILAYGFPTSERKDGVGIEIPFELMVNLASIATVVPRQTGSFFLVGHSVTLFPTAKTGDGIQWHAISTANIEAIAALPEASESIKGMDVHEMASYRTFLGYYEKAHVLLGTRAHIEAYKVADCGLDRTKGSVALGKEGTFNLGFSAKGIINGGIAGKWTLYKHHRVSLIDNRGYFDLLNNARNRPLLIYDTTSCTAWLVSELSLVLHTALTYLRQPSTQCLIGDRYLATGFPNLPYASPCHDGGLASLTACQQSVNHDLELWKAEDGTPKRFWNVIDAILKDLSNIRDAINVRRVTSTSPTWPRKRGLRGWDFQSLATKPDTIYERELPCPGNETTWWKLQEAENMLVIFGRGFGTLIDPSPGKTPFGTSGAPSHAKLLIASTLCVNTLLKEKDGKFYLGPLVWNEPKRNKKSCNNWCNMSSCLCIQELASTPRDVPPKDKLFAKWQAIVFGEAKNYHAALAISYI